MLHRAIMEREEQGETLSRLLPGGLAEKLRRDGRRIGETEDLEVTVLMSDIRATRRSPRRAIRVPWQGQLNRHRAEMNHAVIGNNGTVMQFVGGRSDGPFSVLWIPFRTMPGGLSKPLRQCTQPRPRSTPSGKARD